MGPMGQAPLAGIRVLDFSRVLAGPYAGMLLGDLGAEVLKIEEPGTGDPSRHNAPYLGGESHYFLAINRNKKGLALDLKQPAARQVVRDLVARSDVLIENFRPGVMARLELDYESLSALNPRLIYCSISGFGQEGPLWDTPAYNEVIQAMSGVLSMNGDPDRPPLKLGLPVGDLAGALFAVIGIQSALVERERTGRGQWVDAALYDCLIGMLGYMAGLYFATGVSPVRVGSGHHSVAPIGVYPATDGFLALSIFTTKFWVAFCKAAGRPDLATDPRFARARARVENKKDLEAVLRDLVSRRSLAEWHAILSEADVPHSPVQSVAEALDHPHTLLRKMVVEMAHPTAGTIRATGRTLKFSQHPGDAPFLHPPLLGEHTAEVLQRLLGYTPQQVEELLAQKAIDQWRPEQQPGEGRSSV